MARVIIPYKPRYPELHELMETRRFVVIVAHRRFGKTVVAVNHLIRRALTTCVSQGHFAYVAPFRVQAKAVAWDYLKHYTKNIPGRRINESELSIALPSPGGQARVRIFGADNPNSLRGLYFDGVVLDEVAQMKPDAWEEIIQPALADRQGFAVFIGTPRGINLFSATYFHAVKEQAKGSQHWGAACYPVDKTTALPPDEVNRLRLELSEAKFRQEMLCDFTASSDDILISLDEVNAACARQPDYEMAAQWPLVIGVDVARFGEDATVFFPRQGQLARPPVVIRKKSNTDVARQLAAYILEQKPALVNIDQGQGTGVIDLVRELAPDVSVIEVPFGSQALDAKRYANRRAEMWTLLRDWIKAGGCLGLCDSLAIKQELTAPCYNFDPQGRIRLEAKEDIRKRLKHSTDLGDALALTFASKLKAKAVNARDVYYRNRREADHEYDPFS